MPQNGNQGRGGKEVDDMFFMDEVLNEAPAYDKEEWILQKKTEKQFAYKMIEQMSEMVGLDGERLKDYMDVQAKFGFYSVGNVLLITAQKPDATLLEDYKTWKDMGASILRGEKGIVILEPGGSYTRPDGKTVTSINTKKVFDITQTTNAEHAMPKVKRDGKLLLKALVKFAPCEVELDDKWSKVPKGMTAFYDPSCRAVFVEQGHTEEELFRAISRELAFAYLAPGNKNREENIFRAECVSYIICRRNLIDVSGFSFDKLPESFSQKTPKGIREELSEIRNAALQISLDMNRFFEKQKADKSRNEAR